MVNDPRWPDLVKKEVTPETRVVLLGFPVDTGVARNAGRIGAAHAPRRIRQQLGRFTPDARAPQAHANLLASVADLGDVSPAGSLEADQEQLGALVAEHLRENRIVIVLGGGHETTFGHFLGYTEAGKPVHLRNIDAHADVRPLKNGTGHSGSPFRQALEHASGKALSYAVAGLEPHTVAAEHADFVRKHGFLHWRSEFDTLDSQNRIAFFDRFYKTSAAALASFDIDAVNAGSAPGVSAVNPAGLTVATWLEAAFSAGKSGSVTSMDVVEMNPLYDIDQRTARLAALTVWTFTAGLAQRASPSAN